MLLCSRRLHEIQNYADQQNFELEIQNFADPQELPELFADFHADPQNFHADPQTFKFKKMLISKHLNFGEHSYRSFVALF